MAAECGLSEAPYHRPASQSAFRRHSRGQPSPGVIVHLYQDRHWWVFRGATIGVSLRRDQRRCRSSKGGGGTTERLLYSIITRNMPQVGGGRRSIAELPVERASPFPPHLSAHPCVAMIITSQNTLLLVVRNGTTSLNGGTKRCPLPGLRRVPGERQTLEIGVGTRSSRYLRDTRL